MADSTTVNVPEPDESSDVSDGNNEDQNADITWGKAGMLCLGFVIYFGLPAMRLFIIFSLISYDTICLLVFEHASVIDCDQDGIFHNPERWILAWLIMSVISSFCFLYIFYLKDNFQKIRSYSFSSTCKKGSFVSFLILFILTMCYYVWQIVTTGLNKGITICLMIWTLLMIIIVKLLNYTSGVHYEKLHPGNCLHTNCLHAQISLNKFFFIYWISLITYCIETLAKLFIVTIDIAYESITVIDRPISQEMPKGYAILFSTFRLAFHTRLFLFFWNKIFHGDRDLFSEPCSKLKGGHAEVPEIWDI